MSTLARTAPLWLVGLLAAGCVREANPTTEPRPPDSRVGRAAPEIEGVDGAGRRFRLSDYRGKVVLLHFWRES
jgi:hypothetical protein